MARLCRNGCCWQVFERGWPAKTINRFEVDLRKEERTDERTDGRTNSKRWVEELFARKKRWMEKRVGLRGDEK
jgi:hypothetical protein